jgi:3D (Asp-Asp-Asp) domain-containing protein
MSIGTAWMALRRLVAGSVCAALCLSAMAACSSPTEHELLVTATAYNSLAGQTHGDPALAAWGDRLEPGMKAIAVSRDLIAMGLGHGAAVRIEGLPGEYRVLDKLHKRWKKRIDVYMGLDKQAAIDFGKRELRIFWRDAQAK